MTSDPIGLAGGLNTYAYANNTPLAQTDAYGLMPLEGPGTLSPGRTGNPISGPYRPPPTRADKIGDFVIKQMLKKLGGSMGIPPQIIGVAGGIGKAGVFVGLMATPVETAKCQTLTCDLDDDGLSDKEFSEGLCKPGFN